MIYVGLDMSIQAAGVCIMVEDGRVHLRTLAAEGKNNKLRRASQINRVLEMIEQTEIADRVGMICIERIVMHGAHSQGAAQLITLGEVMADEVVARGWPLIKIVTFTAKKYFTGSGKADKSAMVATAVSRGYAPEDDNQADALALATMARDIIAYRSGELRGYSAAQVEALEKFKGA